MIDREARETYNKNTTMQKHSFQQYEIEYMNHTKSIMRNHRNSLTLIINLFSSSKTIL